MKEDGSASNALSVESTVFPKVHGCNDRDELFYLDFGIWGNILYSIQNNFAIE
ncbi:hypothetical protein NNO_0642 [Hydrogenimonas sp.]|nr:hypothetical protein NNO_0642 [Hydrogenimonas sp.]